MLKKMKSDAMIMHPLPRVDEISSDVDSTSHAKYLQNMVYIQEPLFCPFC